MLYTFELIDCPIFQLDVVETGWIGNVKVFYSLNKHGKITEEKSFECDFLYRYENDDGSYNSAFGYNPDFIKACSGKFHFQYYVEGNGPYTTAEDYFQIFQ